ncbi:unnamed protein product [Eruca vesicaria subsp. sativa]|uniref:Uncharacterized protein n=1 Tax=Eruca vesicaria subsp. sativa TaxID=29727 RepID=A0ABC8M605_ERUVS|nr:unnamed protein product [Eruca vesicaria subsp. sativa]
MRNSSFGGSDDCLCVVQIGKHRYKLMNYMLFLRITTTLPNLFINLASPIFDVPFHVFFLATLVGLIPAAYITVRAGLAIGDLKPDLYFDDTAERKLETLYFYLIRVYSSLEFPMFDLPQVIDLLLFKGIEELTDIVDHAKQRHHIIGQYVVAEELVTGSKESMSFSRISTPATTFELSFHYCIS